MQRKKGDGSFRKLPNGIEYSVSIGYDAYGKRQRMRFYGKTETECRKRYKDFMKGGEKQPTGTKEYTLSKWLDLWLVTYKKGNVEDSTYNDYIGLASHAKKHKIGKMKLSQVKSLHITEFFSNIIGYSHSFRKRMRFLLNGAFECAIDNDFCTKNPVKRAEIAKKTQPEKEAYTEEETRVIIEFAKTDKLFGLPIYIMLNTGIRSGEMRALTTDKIDFENGVIKIDSAIKHTGKLGRPKNGKTRYIPLEEDVIEYLTAKIQKNVKYLIGDSDYVTAAGFRSRYLWFFERLNKHLIENDEAALPKKPPHSTRHTFGTLLQKNGMPIAMVAALLGHNSTDVTDKYTHLRDVNILSEAVKKYPLLNRMA
jgi:integrase